MGPLEPLWAALATAGFAVLFDLRGVDLVLAAAGGALGWASSAPLVAANVPRATALFAASAIIGVWAEALAAIRKRPATVYIVCAIIPLVPGGGMYRTMLEYIDGDSWGAFWTGLATLQDAGAIAAGLAVSGAASRLLSRRAPRGRPRGQPKGRSKGLTSPGRSPRSPRSRPG